MTANEIKIALLAKNPDLLRQKRISATEAVKLLHCDFATIKEYMQHKVIKFFVSNSENENNKSSVQKRYYTSLLDILAFQILIEDMNFPNNFPETVRDVVLKYNQPASDIPIANPEEITLVKSIKNKFKKGDKNV